MNFNLLNVSFLLSSALYQNSQIQNLEILPSLINPLAFGTASSSHIFHHRIRGTPYCIVSFFCVTKLLRPANICNPHNIFPDQEFLYLRIWIAYPVISGLNWSDNSSYNFLF